MKSLKMLMFVGFFMILAFKAVKATTDPEKPRVIVLTDIENEPDDAQSLVRFLTYANHFEVEGIIATTSIWLPDKTAEWRIYEILEVYKEVQPNLEKHEESYPAYEDLKEKIKVGIPLYGMKGVGEGKDSGGSDWIIETLKKDDSRPLWVLAWGGPNCLAQALWKLEQTASLEDLKNYVSKLRVYTISDQDDSGPWMRNRYPGLFYICTPGYSHAGKEGYHFATWSGISGDTFHGRFPGGNREVISKAWIKENIQENHGPLGAQYPDVAYLMEGDTPSFLYLINNGLGSSEHPDYGSWEGGEFSLSAETGECKIQSGQFQSPWVGLSPDHAFYPVSDRQWRALTNTLQKGHRESRS